MTDEGVLQHLNNIQTKSFGSALKPDASHAASIQSSKDLLIKQFNRQQELIYSLQVETQIHIISNELDEVVGVVVDGEMVIKGDDVNHPSNWIELLKKLPNIKVEESVL